MQNYLPFRVKVKFFLKKALPMKAFDFVHFLWIKTFAYFIKGQSILLKYQNLFLSKYPKTVQAGPFKGMLYVDKAIGSSYLHKLIGSYEAILHPHINMFKNKDFDTILDIGSAEGYYLIGFGIMFPNAHLVGFEIEEDGRNLSDKMYQKNNLKNKITLLGEATKENVSSFITSKTLLICDCEGGELDILDPKTFPTFLDIDTAIVELHDFIRPGIKKVLIERFEDTHSITIVPFALANPKEFPFFADIKNKKDLYELRRERGCQEQEWMILEKK
ncbi:MAG: hypothetical protein V1652_00350 [bacterium]